MARPNKAGVDYFSHDTTGGKTLFTLEAQFGNDGYAFWFKLLEILGRSETHSYCCENHADWMFLVSKTRVSEDTATEILNLLAKLDAIDAELWAEKIIWSQNLVDRVAPVYKKRGTETPHKPSFCDGNPTLTELPVPESTQSKVKKSKVNKRVDVVYTDNDVEGLTATIKLYTDNTSITDQTPIALKGIKDWCEIAGCDFVQACMESVFKNGSKPWGYIERRVRDFHGRGLRTRADIEKHLAKISEQKQRASPDKVKANPALKYAQRDADESKIQKLFNQFG